ncbi:MAG TPA: allantoinase AllB [Thermoanaerobaculia bacterium]|nr:allantoinase AllB [Thermoanaerobaculia bacterium]
MRPRHLVLKSRRVVTPGGVREASVRIADGRIVEVADRSAPTRGAVVVDIGGRVLMPAAIDTHVHVNEPGRTDWEGFASATRAAAAGGIATLVDMPLNSIPPTTSLEALHAKAEAAAGRCRVHVGFWGGLVRGNAIELERLHNAGAFGFKCFLVDSGVVEFPPVAESDLAAATSRLAVLSAMLLVHAEDAGRITPFGNGRPDQYSSYLRTRPAEAETEAVARMVRLSRESGIRVHILHLSSSAAAEAVGAAKREGLAVTGETCPHYLTFASEEIPDGATEFKCAPPIRDRENRERLWAALGRGEIDLVVSDHSPSPVELKCRDSGDFQKAWGGISSLELSLSATWSGASARGFSMEDLVRWMCRGPAELAGLGGWKGSIAPGFDADLVVFDPDASWTVDPMKLRHRHPLTPYAGRVMKGRVEATYLRGRKVYAGGRFFGPPRGEILLA